MSYRAYCRIPSINKSKFRHLAGGCPQLLDDLISELAGAVEVHIAAYLFNSPIYFEALKNLANNGCKIYVTSLPINGYSDKKVPLETYTEKVSGRDMAKHIYEKIYNNNNMELLIFPHMYMWYGALYAGGGASYSFHVKAVLVKYSNNKYKSILSSGNFMCTDPLHSDNLLVIDDNHEYNKIFQRFFNDVENIAIPFSNYVERYNSVKNDFDYTFLGNEIDLSCSDVEKCFFTAPFYNIEGQRSNHYAGKRLVEIIQSAQSRIWICAQHLHDVSTYDGSVENTIVKSIHDLWQSNPSIKLRFLKQVGHSSLSDKRRAAITEILSQFVFKSEQRINKLVHDKFIIIDDTLIVTTSNYTPTQFAAGERKMEMEIDGDKCVKRDVFSEVNGFVIIPNCPKNLLQDYENHFNLLWNAGTDISVNL